MQDTAEPADRPASARWGALRPVLTVLFSLLVLAIAWLAAGRLAEDVSYADLRAAIAATPAGALAAAGLFTAVSFAALVAYDLGALAYVGRRLPLPAVALASFCAYAVGNTAGFGPLTAGAIRYRFYTPHGVEPAETAGIVAYVTVAFGLGLTAMTALGLLVAADQFTLLPLSPDIVRALAAAVLAVLAALLLSAGSGRTARLFFLDVALPGRAALVRQFLATAVDIAAAASVLWVLLPDGLVPLPAFIAIYAVAVGLGVLSHVPAGLGVFEAVIVAAVGRGEATDAVLGALVLYRVIYHLVPLALAVVTVTLLEARRAAASPAAAALLRTGGRLAPAVLGAFTLVLGAVLLFAVVTPLGSHIPAFHIRLPLPLLEGAQFLASVLGMALIVIARGLVYRMDGAWWAAMAVVPAAILLTLLRAATVNEAMLLGLLLAGLLAARHQFTRHASLLHQALTPNWFLAVATLLLTATVLLFFVYKDVDYANELWWQFELSQHAPRSLRALVGAAVTAGLFAAWALLRPAQAPLSDPTAAELARATAIVAAQPRVEAGLVAMGDKNLIFSDDGQAFIMFGRQGRSWIALADPVGPRAAWPALIWRFVEAARASGGRAAFYQVAPESLALYADAGLRAFKLGEEARVRLPDFDLKGAKRANLRNALNRAERDGIAFAILAPGEAAARMAELSAVSAAWMAHHKVREKRFSLGAFDPAYLAGQPVAVLLQGGRIVAFANMLLTGLKEEASIDLMRFLPDAPNGTMEILLLRVILHCQAEGYGWFSLGMAPMSGLSASATAPFWDRVGRAVYDHGDRFYGFSGLRAFKAKFHPVWEPRYLAVAGGISPMLALADVTVLISGGLKGVVGK